MAFSAAAISCRPPLRAAPGCSTAAAATATATAVSFPGGPVSLRLRSSGAGRRRSAPIRSASVSAAPASEQLKPAISLTDNALKHLNRMRSERSEDLCLRIGVRQGGCSGMSYTMDFENRENARPDDSIIEYNGFVIVGLQRCSDWWRLFIYKSKCYPNMRLRQILCCRDVSYAEKAN
ncbi:hypothetical protein EUGRSUZ_I00313 [Eucalyptus grandis]|uniref:Uncharacterized protein n=2 Tax=Eucalyptus grandis TaxID=71139 RepID=A0ACC3JEI3_EUCGR|nr:hypothetical protein EUGRSUZ_I00313 [Eucalyptus grandis]